jgi:hypothetical protein
MSECRNAGACTVPRLNEDGIEAAQVNHLGPFLLTACC